MHLMGVEPTRESHWNLNPARLPIPPQVRMRKYNPLKFLPEGLHKKALFHEMVKLFLQLACVLSDLEVG